MLDGNSGVSSGGLKKCNKKDKRKKKKKKNRKKKKKEEQSHVRRFRHVTDTELVSAVFLFFFFFLPLGLKSFWSKNYCIVFVCPRHLPIKTT